MKAITRLFFFTFCLPFFAFAENQNINSTQPDLLIKSSVSSLLEVIQKEKDQDIRRQKVSDIYYNAFDVVTMTRMTLKRSWKGLSNEEKSEVAKQFAHFVLTFYTEKLDTYNNNRIEYGKVELKSKTKGVVYTQVEFEGAMAKINYSVRFKNDRWWIYDVDIEGIRLSSQYSSQLQGIYKKKGYTGLITELKNMISNTSKKEKA